MSELKNKKVLLVITGGIAAYKSLELIRILKKNTGSVWRNKLRQKINRK